MPDLFPAVVIVTGVAISGAAFLTAFHATVRRHPTARMRRTVLGILLTSVLAMLIGAVPALFTDPAVAALMVVVAAILAGYRQFVKRAWHPLPGPGRGYVKGPDGVIHEIRTYYITPEQLAAHLAADPTIFRPHRGDPTGQG